MHFSNIIHFSLLFPLQQQSSKKIIRLYFVKELLKFVQQISTVPIEMQ
jgi:hypothetical protein